LGRHGDGARVVLSGDGKISGLVRDIALLLQQGREGLAFLFICNEHGAKSGKSKAQGRTYTRFECLNLFLRQGLV
jgi:hypothetical protein